MLHVFVRVGRVFVCQGLRCGGQPAGSSASEEGVAIPSLSKKLKVSLHGTGHQMEAGTIAIRLYRSLCSVNYECSRQPLSVGISNRRA